MPAWWEMGYPLEFGVNAGVLLAARRVRGLTGLNIGRDAVL